MNNIPDLNESSQKSKSNNLLDNPFGPKIIEGLPKKWNFDGKVS